MLLSEIWVHYIVVIDLFWRLWIRETRVWKEVLESKYGGWREMPRTMIDRKSSY